MNMSHREEDVEFNKSYDSVEGFSCCSFCGNCSLSNPGDGDIKVYTSITDKIVVTKYLE